MKKKEYIDAINEIETDKDLKRKTLDKMSKKKNYKKVYSALATSIIIFVMAISIGLPMINNKNKVTPIEVVEENNGLPRVKDFKDFYNIVKNTKTNDFIYEDNFLESATTDSIDSGYRPSDFSASSGTTQKENNTTDYSETNVQVEGVDEADIVKTDGKYIYYVVNDKTIITDEDEVGFKIVSEVIIINAENSSNLKIVSEIEYDNKSFYPRELYIYENKLIVIGTKRNNNYNGTNSLNYKTYKSNVTTIAKIYNIENKSKPKLEREVETEGSYLSSRMINDNVYFIANETIYTYWFRNKELDEIDENEFKPAYRDTAISSEQKYIDYNEICYFPESEDASYLSVVGFNVNNNEKANIETYLGAGTEIYSSQNNLYITRVKYEYKDTRTHGYYNNYDVNTYIYKFKLEDSKATYITAGSVPGEVLNQFSMDEKDGYFRIATTDSDNWNSETDTNNMYVLNEELKVIGKIEGLAKGEKIYSVRFMGNRAYMVTFVETDPLFVIDLSKPEKPTVLGELKIPGYSKYLHPYDENHVIGFGENTKVNEYGGVVTDGMKMALFDVSNPTKPKELFSTNIGDKGTYSEILNNHKALLFSKEKNIIAFPIYISESNEDRLSKTRFQGAIVYGLDLENGFNVKGTISHQKNDEGYMRYDYMKEIERIIYINDSLYTLSKGLIKSTNMNTMQEEGSLEISEEYKNSISY